MKLLLDSHITKAAVNAIRAECRGVEAVHVADWRAGAFRTAEDEVILAACLEEGRVLVTCDQRTIPDLLRRWAAEEREHAGVIFADRRNVSPGDPGGLARALGRLLQESSAEDMTNTVRYLRAAG